MAAERGQRGQPSAMTDTGVQAHVRRITQALSGGSEAQEQVVVIISTRVGALTLARSVQDKTLAERILETAKNALKKSTRGL